MKTLLIIRHAHAESPQRGISDFDRSLSNRGVQEGVTQAKKLLGKGFTVDGWLCSSSRRTMQTTEILSQHLINDAINIRSIDGLYQATSMLLTAQTVQIPDAWSTTAIIAHNPGITDFVNSLTDNLHIDDMPTAGIVAVTSETEKWMDFFKHPIRFLFFIQPN